MGQKIKCLIKEKQNTDTFQPLLEKYSSTWGGKLVTLLCPSYSPSNDFSFTFIESVKGFLYATLMAAFPVHCAFCAS